MYIFSVTRLINLSAENELYLINIIVKRQAHAFVLVSTGGVYTRERLCTTSILDEMYKYCIGFLYHFVLLM